MLVFFRVSVFAIYFVIVAIFCALVCLFRPFNPNNNRFAARAFSYGGLKILGLEVIVEHPERLNGLSQSVVVANHQSNLDLFVLGGLVPLRTASIGKSSLKWIPFFGQVYWLAGNVMIDRTNAKQSIDAMDQVRAAIIEDERSIWVFPEGTRNLGRGLGAFKKGAFHIAIQAQCPIYPVVSSTYSGRLKLNERASGTVRISLLPPIETKGLTKEDVTELMQRVHLSIAEEIARLDRLVQQPVDE
ncbi:hypothetical protein A3765_10045 [Oleiphilus sp. HI0130]|jgi:1-acyl-sn-glycerol-3-phosphate acyltransferase|uniref:lysophospholipid acyltransferase family protein n=1 Tax=unclassified Oleiphilus TaxID=2631174 RepID=UPI0007C2D284|nr:MULTISPECIES: 1-acylglycerol-3-phosphate O-acyltransferase [unclassified Oleiphilus]KZY63998.1 hypothetical protein A3737_14305 [Oleiphilus sp. HI0065]KZZ06122.1 hypothetical protein A3744_07555 [Oleiphilus sp. HI0073]KZZ40159.1 hypothetical protein A3758_09810 [Oleiphilus sp. HI0118]KZZ51935.1 hypothetical protein A3760_11275 [Oleiphilus sp. HI0122]KZZ76203.1 hypothetical protein A3765_10045 [Oleiphilus sp. HI0130]KZZ76300.1 hypothetical protein A3767_15130 [Oleiphilus sp. HI0133]